MTLFDYARSLRDIGLSVFPIPIGQKKPVVHWKPYQDRLATDDELLAWFGNGPANLGIVTGAISNVVVVDADDEPATRWLVKRIPRTTTWHTQTARGWHLWFGHPGSPIPNRGTDLRTDAGTLPIHIRGDGGYVLGHGSLHPSGTVYRSTVQAPRPYLPQFSPAWLDLLVDKPSIKNNLPCHTTPRLSDRPGPQRPCHPTKGLSDGFLRERARRYLAAIPPPVIGCGSDTQTFKVACRLVRGFELDAADAEDLLWEWAGGRAGWDRDWIAAKVTSALRSGQEVLGGLR